MEKLVYYAAGDEKKESQVRKLAEVLGLVWISVSALETSQTVGYLTRTQGYAKIPVTLAAMPPQIPEDMLLFCNLNEKKLDHALALIRNSGVSIALKAVVTPHNIRWTLADLYRELSEERRMMNRRK